MKMMTTYELAAKTEKELSMLFRLATDVLVMSERGSAQRRNALGSLEAISRARAARLCGLRL